MKKAVILALVLGGYVFSVGASQGEECLAQLFQGAVSASGEEYVDAREQIVSRGKEAEAFSRRLLRTSKDWREQVLARAVQGWIDYPDLYGALWDWKAPRNSFRNPFPLMRMQAREKFSGAGKKSIPLMLELIWKKQETHHGVLPELLSEWGEESSLPVFLEYIVTRPGWPFPSEALGRLGEKATPYVTAALRGAHQYARVSLLDALGHTGDPKAVPVLRHHLGADEYGGAREAAATSLGNLNKYYVLREEIPRIADWKTRIAIVQVLGKDHCKETRQLLRKFATLGQSKEERLASVRAILDGATDEDIASVCEIVPLEPDDYTRSSMYVFLSSHRHGLVRESLLQAVHDKSEWVRRRAISGLRFYDDEEVTNVLLWFVRRSDQHRRGALGALQERSGSGIAEAVIPLLKNEDREIRMLAARVLRKNPSEDAIAPLIEMLSSQDGGVRFNAVEPLVSIGGEKALRALQEALRREQDDVVKMAITRGIRKLSETAAKEGQAPPTQP